MKRKIVTCLSLIVCICTLAGCGQKIQNVSINIDHAENPVVLSVFHCKELEGKEDVIDASTITSNEKGNIVTVSTCFDWGDEFDGSYNASAKELKSAVFSFDVEAQEYYDLVCGPNYYDLIMWGTVRDADKILITYGEEIELQGVTGDFSAFVYVLSDDCPMQFGQDIITVFGTLEETGNVVLSWDGEKFTLFSDKKITNCKAITEPSHRDEEFTTEAESTGTSFDISIVDGKPVFSDIE